MDHLSVSFLAMLLWDSTLRIKHCKKQVMRDVCGSSLTTACGYTITLKNGVRNLEKADSIPLILFHAIKHLYNVRTNMGDHMQDSS